MTVTITPTVLAHHLDATLRPDLGRTIAQLFLPGEELPQSRSRAEAIVTRVLDVPEDQITEMAAGLLRDFGPRHRNYREGMLANAAVVRPHLPANQELSPDRALVLGSCFTAEFALEGAALCNPSAVQHPDQTGLEPGQLRVALSVRAIGEGHRSSIGFATAVVGPGPSWVYEPRALPAVAGQPSSAGWRRAHLSAVLADAHGVDELTRNVLAALPETFTAEGLQLVLGALPPELVARTGVEATITLLRQLVASAYEVSFPADVALSQQALLPFAAEESGGMEDARFLRFVDDDGTVEYRGTYTAYDGHRIVPRVLTSPDLRSFGSHRLAGPAARNKGMAPFPRKVNGLHLSLCRSDGENTSIASSRDGFVWGDAKPLHRPSTTWDLLQVGNCGPPIETDDGWLVLTHGVGPMRVYAIGALLLDLDEPTRVLRRLSQPLLQTGPGEREGYVPNVVYSCGGLLHDGRVFIPYGIGDARINVAWADLGELVAAMVPAG